MLSRTPLTGAQSAPPRGGLCSPHSAQSQLARACAVGLVTFPPPAAPLPTKKGKRTAAARPRDKRLGEGDCPTPDTSQKARRPSPKATSSHPDGAQCEPAGARAVGLVTGPHARTPCAPGIKGSVPQPPAPTADGRGRESVQSSGYHSTPPGNGKGDARTAPPPPPTTRRARPQQEAQRGMNCLERLYQRPARGPREGRTPKSNRRWGDGTTGRCACTQTEDGDAACTKRAIGPS